MTRSSLSAAPAPAKSPPDTSATSRLSFSNLPADGTVNLYTILGERVRTLTANAAGLALWDGNNDNGLRVATGTYLAVIKGAGGRKVQRVVIIR